jgi:enoyl-CoA hydratase/carnithine racemase
MAYSEILYEERGPVARITLNRPEKRNPLGPTTIGELLHALERARADEAIRVIVLTGQGKVFSAGGDLSSFSSLGGSGGTPLKSDASTTTRPGTFVDLNLAMTKVGKPTIAMVNGHALAGGLGLVVACDVAIAADDAQLGTPEINVGLWPMMITATIFRNVPRKRGLELIMTGDRISAAEAASMGLITRAVPRDQLEAEVDALAQKLAGKSPVVLRMGLEAFYKTEDLELQPALEYLQAQLVAVLGTEDAREGLTAFLEKRAPQWKGR